jgi:hypothetical protein
MPKANTLELGVLEASPGVVYVCTWKTEWSQAVREARDAVAKGCSVRLLRLASQPYPTSSELSVITLENWPLLAIPNRFEHVLPKSPAVDFLCAVKRAELQWREGMGAMLTPATEGPHCASVNAVRAKELTEAERRAFLTTVYAEPGDDGVRS